jgi:hypothetical protein
MSAWIQPTARATEWPALAAVIAGLAGVSTVATYAGRWPVGLAGITAAALAAAIVAGLRDPAANLLSALPTSAAVRRARRLALLVPAGLAAWAAHVGSARLVEPATGWSFAPLIALIATAVAVTVWSPPGIGVAAGVAAPLAWVAAQRALGEPPGIAADLWFGWQEHPYVVTAAAVAALLIGRNR